MATRKNFKKTGKKRIKSKGGAKKRKTVRGGMFSFFKNAKVHQTPINELTVEQWFSNISTVLDELTTASKQKPLNQKLIEKHSTYFLNLRKRFKDEEFVKKLKIFLLDLINEEDLEAKLGILSKADLIEDEFKENIRIEFKENIRLKNNHKFIRNMNFMRDNNTDETNIKLSNPLNSPELSGMIQSYGMQYSPKGLFNFLKSIKEIDLTVLTVSQKSTMFSFKTYFESNKEEINDFLKKQTSEDIDEYHGLLEKFKFNTE